MFNHRKKLPALAPPDQLRFDFPSNNSVVKFSAGDATLKRNGNKVTARERRKKSIGCNITSVQSVLILLLDHATEGGDAARERATAKLFE